MTVNSRELVLAALRCQPTARVPWIPYVGCHGGALVGKTATEYLTEPAAVAYGLATALERYRPDGLPVIFDLQIEAEALGCQLHWSDENPPAVGSHPLAGGQPVGSLELPGPADGRYPFALEAIRQSRELVGDRIALFGLITGPFTLALHLLGPEIFMEMFDQPERICELTDFTAAVGRLTAEWYLAAGCDVIAVVDPMTSQISPAHFEEFVTAPARSIFGGLRERGVPGAFFVCGDAQRNLEKMCECGPDAVFVDEQIDLVGMGEIARRHGVAFGGNIPLTTVMLHGTPDDNRRAARHCLDLGGATGFLLAPGCDIPYAVPPANIAAIAEVVHGEHSGQVAAGSSAAFEVEVPDYAAQEHVQVDIFTLDSAACAPCQYMVEAVEKALPQFEGRVVFVEHKLKTPETVGLMGALKVTSIPSIAIDGEVAFSSLIPEQRTLAAAIQERLTAKEQ
ncbi:MAG: thioredoxin family protein [Armatimonadetes bacterium]|nr:thioredoxin family protein [Armatimonadota bacterium]